MSVSNGQSANQTTFNNAFISKTTDSTTVANIELADTDVSQGSTVTQVQREHNSIASYTGKSLNAAKDVKPSWSTNNLGTSTDSLFARVNSIDGLYGAANGICPTDGSNKVPAAYLPSYVDDVLEYADLASFPVSGETGKIYVAIDTGKTYRWTGSIYVEISASEVNSVFGRTGVVTAQSGDYTATQVTNTPAGNIAATTVQAAINELDSEKVPTTRTITAGSGLSGGGDFSADRTISMPNVGTANTYGSSTQVPVFTTDAQGRVSAVTNTDIYSSNNDGATGANATLSSVTTSVVRLTNGSLTSIDMVPAGFSAQQFILINRTGVAVTVNNNTGGTPANRILTGTGANLSFSDDTALFLEYDTTEARWQVVGGSGSGGVSTVDTIDSQTKSANGAVISGTNLVMQTADASFPGLVSTGAQTLAGQKTLSSAPILSSLTASRPLKVDGSNIVTATQIALGSANDVTGTLAIGNGGTGQTSATSAFNALSPLTTKGDLIGWDSSNNVRVPVGTNGTFLKADSSVTAGITWTSTISTSSTRSVTTTDTSTNADDVLILSGASFTETLFTAVGNTGKIITLIHNGTSLTQVYTLNTTSGQTIGGIASGSYKLITNGEMLKIISDGSNWLILDHKAETAPTSGVALTIEGTTTNPTKGTMTTDLITWRRVGDRAFFHMQYVATTAGTAGSGNYLVVLPDSLTMHSAQPVNTGTTSLSNGLAMMSGTCFGQANTGSISILYPQAHSTTRVKFGGTIGGAVNYWGSGGVALNNTNVQMVAWFDVKIADWQP